MSDNFLINCLLVFVAGYIGYSLFYGSLNYNNYYSLFKRAEEAGYLDKLMQPIVYILGGYFLTSNIIAKIAFNINKTKQEDTYYHEIRGYQKKYKIRNIFMFTFGFFLIGTLLLDVYLGYKCINLSYYSNFLLKLSCHVYKDSSLYDCFFYGGFLTSMISMLICTIVCGKLIKLEKKILNYIEVNVNEKLKARDILASHQIN